MKHACLMTSLCITALVLAACAAPQTDETKHAVNGVAVGETGPVNCKVTDTTPALIETRTVQLLETPAVLNPDGSTATPARYRSESSPRIVQKRQLVEIETPCQALGDPDFIASLQRALKARGHMYGTINGLMDRQTLQAVRSYQAGRGLNSDVLSLGSARALGLVAQPRQ